MLLPPVLLDWSVAFIVTFNVLSIKLCKKSLIPRCIIVPWDNYMLHRNLDEYNLFYAFVPKMVGDYLAINWGGISSASTPWALLFLHSFKPIVYLTVTIGPTYRR